MSKKIFVPVYIEATNLGEAWVRLMWSAFAHGKTYFIEEGSRAGQHRLTMDMAIAAIHYPEDRPLFALATDGKVVPTNEEDIVNYFNQYVYNPEPPAPNEHYKYSEFLFPQANAIIEYWQKYGVGNAHTVMRVGNPFAFLDYFSPYSDEATRKTTPCLLSIQAKVIEGRVTFYVVYRSWDLFSGFPVNNGGFQLLKEFMAHEAGLEPGPTVVMCPDLHLYEEDLTAAGAWIGQSQEAQALYQDLLAKRVPKEKVQQRG